MWNIPKQFKYLTAYLISCFFNHRATTSVAPETNNPTVMDFPVEGGHPVFANKPLRNLIRKKKFVEYKIHTHKHTRVQSSFHHHKIAPSHPLNKFSRFPPFYLFSSFFTLDLPLNHFSLLLCCSPPNSWRSCEALSLVLIAESLVLFFIFFYFQKPTKDAAACRFIQNMNESSAV